MIKPVETSFLGMESSILIDFLQQPCKCGCSEFKIIGRNRKNPPEPGKYWEDNAAFVRKLCDKCGTIYFLGSTPEFVGLKEHEWVRVFSHEEYENTFDAFAKEFLKFKNKSTFK